ncbi:MAG TPA: hypothetical protein DD379_25260 [Cyanobacteria bacterium UBA11162]|nr:hypothetical protein [Cyanobacteria bacterium UBA11162]
MIRFFRRRLISILLIAFVVFSVARVLANTTQENLEPSEPPLVITEEFKNIPHNPSTPRDGEDIEQGRRGLKDGSARERILKNKREQFAEFAWKDFVALNWPVSCSGDDIYKDISLLLDENNKPYNILIGQEPKASRAWELYPSPKDVFKENGAEPTPLTELPEVKKCLGDGSGSEIEYGQNLRLTETGELVGKEKIAEVRRANEGKLLNSDGELKEEISLQAIDDAINFPLVDQQGNYVINEIRMNPVEYNQIKDNKWYEAKKLNELIESEKMFHLFCSNKASKSSNHDAYCGENGYKDEGSIEIKAAWRVFDGRNSEQEKEKYYTTKRKIISQTGDVLNEQAELGLIGFHIMHKTSEDGWVWSTFEHVDNAPLCSSGDKQEMKSYTLYSKNKCATQENCKENYPYVEQPYVWNISNEGPKAVTIERIAVEEGRITAVKNQIPSQICRLYTISKNIEKANNTWKQALKDVNNESVWQYYQLIGVQWLRKPESAYNENLREIKIDDVNNNEKFTLENMAMEPYIQGVSCIVCHTSAHLKDDNKATIKADFSFLMDNAK